MRKQILSLFLITIVFTGYSQNKKEQIEELNARIDSCKTVLTSQNNQITQLKTEIERLKLSEAKMAETIKQKEGQIKESEVKSNQLLTENKQLKEKIAALENPPMKLSGHYVSGDLDGFQFELDIFDEQNSGFSFNYLSFCVLGRNEFSSTGEGKAIKEISETNKFRCLGGSVVDEAAGEQIQIEFLFTSTGLKITIVNPEEGAFCWESEKSFIVTKEN